MHKFHSKDKQQRGKNIQVHQANENLYGSREGKTQNQSDIYLRNTYYIDEKTSDSVTRNESILTKEE